MEPDGETIDGGSSAVKLKNRAQGHEVRDTELPEGVWQPGCPWIYVHAHVPVCMPRMYVSVCKCPGVCALVCVDRHWWGHAGGAGEGLADKEAMMERVTKVHLGVPRWGPTDGPGCVGEGAPPFPATSMASQVPACPPHATLLASSPAAWPFRWGPLPRGSSVPRPEATQWAGSLSFCPKATRYGARGGGGKKARASSGLGLGLQRGLGQVDGKFRHFC